MEIDADLVGDYDAPARRHDAGMRGGGHGHGHGGSGGAPRDADDDARSSDDEDELPRGRAPPPPPQTLPQPPHRAPGAAGGGAGAAAAAAEMPCYLCAHAGGQMTEAMAALTEVHMRGVAARDAPRTIAAGVHAAWDAHVYQPAFRRWEAAGRQGAPPQFFSDKSFLVHITEHTTSRVVDAWTTYETLASMCSVQVREMARERERRAEEADGAATWEYNDVRTLGVLLTHKRAFMQLDFAKLGASQVDQQIAGALAAAEQRPVWTDPGDGAARAAVPRLW
jgi:hypothetical protein